MTEPIDIEAIRGELLSKPYLAPVIAHRCLDRLEELEPIVKWAPREMKAKDVPDDWEYAWATRSELTWLDKPSLEHVNNLEWTVLARPKQGWPSAGKDDYTDEEGRWHSISWHGGGCKTEVIREYVERAPSPLPETVQAVLEEVSIVTKRWRQNGTVRIDLAELEYKYREHIESLQPPEPEQLYRVLEEAGLLPGKWYTVTLDRLRDFGVKTFAHVHPLDENGRALAELTEVELAELLGQS